MCSAVDFGSGDVDHAFDIQDLCFDLADADDKVFLFVPGFGQAVKVVLNSFLHRRFDGRPGGRTGKSQSERHVDRGSGHTFDRDDVSDRGDTVTDAANPAAEALPGYRPAQSMVYCGIYTEDGSKYPDLRDALEKLQLNDASLTFEPESSVALGFGFRCGFLGMLHMEIIQERLEREFNLDLVTTLPSVIYHVYKSDGTMVKVDNPHNYPDPGTIEHAEEPYVKVSIISPQDYVGNIMPMCQERRGEFKDMQYLDTHLVELHYQMPLNEIIYDFFDTLKANTKGYASLDYELSGYRTSDLVKVDLLLNGDGVDALSFIAHRDKAYPRARRLCEKLKENIPRQLFEVPIQAAIGGRIIARETVKAMRKDVLAKCYGGDITRKKKLLEKQKEGKKKMRNLGTVQVPTEAFMAVLKLEESTADEQNSDLRDGVLYLF